MEQLQGLTEQFSRLATAFAAYAWGPWLLVLLLGGGAFFLLYTRFTPFRHIPHALAILRGKYDSPDDPGDITHFQALSSALAGTIGMGNIAGVALAIAIGGPGAIFWNIVPELLFVAGVVVFFAAAGSGEVKQIGQVIMLGGLFLGVRQGRGIGG